MRKSIIIILLLIINPVFGQDKEDPTELFISEFKKEMKKESISNFFIIKHITYGSFLIPDVKDPNPCYPKSTYFTIYTFWNKGKESYIKKFDNCSGFNNVKLNDSKVIDFYKENLEKLNTEEVGIYTIKQDSIVNGNKLSFISTKSHSPLRFFWFYQDSMEFKKDFDKYDLETKEDNKNLNYESNNNLSIVKLNLICEKIIYKLEEKKIFTRIK